MKENFLLITGGTGGHVIPAKNFANYLSNKNINCTIITDKRGYKYFDNYNGKIYIISSSNLNGNLIFKIFGIFQILLGLIQSFIIIFLLKPSHSISFGSYASFSPMLTCMLFKPIYKVKLYIHEQNSIIGRTNKFFLNFSNKLFLNFDIKSKINSKFKDKIFVVGSPENNFQKNAIQQHNLDQEELEFLRLNLIYSSKCQSKKLFSTGFKVGTPEYKECIMRKGNKSD